MQSSKPFSRLILILLMIFSIVLCPLTSDKLFFSHNVMAGNLRQIDFAPHLSPLALTQTAESIEIDPNLKTTPAPIPTYAPGQYFEDDDPNKPWLDDDLSKGTRQFGYAQFI